MENELKKLKYIKKKHNKSLKKYFATIIVFF